MSQLSFEMDAARTNVFVTYGNENVRFSMNYYKRNKHRTEQGNNISPFYEFNEWLKTKPRQWQENVYQHYKRIRNIIDEENDVEVMLSKLNEAAVQLYSNVNLDEIESWVKLPTSPCNVPTKPTTSYENTRKNPRETTYVYSDYLGLVVYSIALRFVAPIWGDIDSRLYSQYGKDYKEIYAKEILHKTCLDGCVAENRLREFMINAKVQVDTNTVLMSGLSEDDFYNYMLAIIILRRLSLGDVSGSDNTYRLIINIYYYFQTKIKQVARSYGSNTDSVKFKKNPVEDKKTNSDSNSQSVYDVGFSRSKISTDDKVFLEFAAKDHDRIIQIVEPELPKELYWEAIDAIRVNFNIDNLSGIREYMKPIQEIQLNIVKWVLDEAINPVIYDYLDLETVIDLLGLTSAILWHRGYYEFAALVSAIAINTNSDDFFIAPTYRRNIDSHLSNRLNKTYCLGGTTKSEKRNMTALGCIELFEKGISPFNWYLTLPDKWANSGKIINKDNRLITQSDIRVRIAELMLDIANRQKLVPVEAF